MDMYLLCEALNRVPHGVTSFLGALYVVLFWRALYKGTVSGVSLNSIFYVLSAWHYYL